jgi:hypothetical protein
MNLEGRGADPTSLAHKVAGIYVPELTPLEQIETKAIRIDPKILDLYMGQYKINPKVIITISRETNRLITQITGRPGKAELFAESETKFFLKVEPTQFTFVKDEKGRVTHVIVHEPRRDDTKAKKVK